MSLASRADTHASCIFNQSILKLVITVITEIEWYKSYYLADRWSSKLLFRAIISEATMLNWFSLNLFLDSSFIEPLSTTALPFSPGQLLGFRPSLALSSSTYHCWIFFLEVVCKLVCVVSWFVIFSPLPFCFLMSLMISNRCGIFLLL